MNQHIRENPPPFALQHRWFGLTYINVVWQDRMVSGMLIASDPVPSVAEIIDRTEEAAYYQGKDGRAQVSMSIIDVHYDIGLPEDIFSGCYLRTPPRQYLQ